MPSQLDSNELVKAYKKKFGDMFFYILQKLLITNDAIVAGGSVLAPYDTTGKTKINDLDIYVHERNAQSLFAQFSNIKLTPDMMFGFVPNDSYNTMMEMAEESPDAVERINTNEGATSDNILVPLFKFENSKYSRKLQPPYDRSFFVKNNILLRLPMFGRGFTNDSPIYIALDERYIYQFPYIKIDVLVVDDSVSLTSVPENFDLSFCKVWWNGNEVLATNPDDISNKRGTLSPDYVSALLQGNRFTLDRISKYKNRGFKVIIPNMCIPEQVLEKQTKEIVSDERWIVSKIIEGIEILLNDGEKLVKKTFSDVPPPIKTCFDNKKQKFIKEISQNDRTIYSSTIFILDALKNFNKDYQGPIFTMENINNLYVNLFEFLELDLEGLRLLLNVNHQGLPDCDFGDGQYTNDMTQRKFIEPKEQFIQEIKTIFYKMWALQEGSDNLDEFRRENANKEIPENIKKEVLQRFFQIYMVKCQIATLKNICEKWIAGNWPRELSHRKRTKNIFKKYLGIINNTFPDLDENNKLDKLIMDSDFLMNKVLDDTLIPKPYYSQEFPTCEQSPYLIFLLPEYIYTKKYQDKIEDPRISYVVYRNNSCSVPIKGYVKPIPEFGGLIEPNQVFDTREQCQEYKKQLLIEQQRRTAEARERGLAQYGDLTDPDVSGDIDDFVIPGGTYGVDEIPGKCYRAEDSGKDLSEKWYEKGKILFLMHFSEIDPNQEDLTVCVSKEYLEERMNSSTNIYYTCNGPRVSILNGDRRRQVIPIEEVRPDERYDRLPLRGADVTNQEETFIKINMAEEQLRDESGQLTVDTTVPAYLRINDVRKIIQIINENPDKTRVFSLIPDGERTHTVTKSVMDGGSIVGGFHCQNNSVINIFKVREFVPKTGAPGEWRDIITLPPPPPPVSPPQIPRTSGLNLPIDDILAPFTREVEGTEINEQQRPAEDTVIEDQELRILPGQIEQQDYYLDLDELQERIRALGPGQNSDWEQRFFQNREAGNYDVRFLSRLRRWLDESEADPELFAVLGPDDFRPDPPITEEENIDELVIPGQVEEQDFNPDLDNLYQRLDNLVDDEITQIRADPPDPLNQTTENLINDARNYLGQGWRDRLDLIRTPYSNDDLVFLSRLRRWLEESERNRDLRFWNPQDFRADPPLDVDRIYEIFADGAGSDTGSIGELASESDDDEEESNTARQLFADDQSIDENNNQITQEEFEDLITDTRMAIVNANMRMTRARQELFNQEETDNAYDILDNTTIEDVDRIYELRRLIDERLQNLPNP